MFLSGRYPDVYGYDGPSYRGTKAESLAGGPLFLPASEMEKADIFKTPLILVQLNLSQHFTAHLLSNTVQDEMCAFVHSF